MADQKVEYLPPAEFQSKSPLDYTKIIPAGVGSDPQITEQFQKANKAAEDYAASLEQRFAQPNWFKIAAGFAKPQLGGFLASLGSASEAFGQQQEAARAIAPAVARMRAEVASGQLTFGQRMKQKELMDKWRITGKPMDATTYEEIVGYGADTDVAKAAKGYFDAAKAGMEITKEAVTAMGKDPLMPLEDFTKFQLRPDTDEKSIKQKQEAFVSAINAAKPPQIEQAQWDAMSRYEKMEESANYARAQREAGMGVEATFQQQAQQAPSRLSLLRSIRDLALGIGIEPSKTKDGQTITGQQQMALLLNYFGGNNPFEVLARAAADGKLGEKLADIDQYARQANLSDKTRDQFQKLVKLLAENQVTLRNGAVNPTDQFSALQQAGSPNIGNSQTALVTLVDLMGHAEKNAIDKYNYVLDKKIPFRQLGVDVGYLDKQRQYAEEHSRIATSNPLVNTPPWYNPAGKGTQAQPAAPAPAATSPAPAAGAPSGTPKNRPNERRMPDGSVWVRQPDGSYERAKQ